MILIGITGPAGVGKDTAGDYLVRTYGFEKLSWAAPMKAGLAAMGFPEPANRDDKEELIEGFPFSWREAAQKIGTEWGRGLDPDIWVKLMEKRLQRGDPRRLYGADKATGHPLYEERRYVITDVRFENEAEMIRRAGGTIVHLTGRAVDLGANAGHASEAGISEEGGDWRVPNDGTLADLAAEIEGIVQVLKRRAAP